jgi:hypothetical protein
MPGPNDPLRTQSDSQAIKLAASSLGIGLKDIQPVSHGRTGIYRVIVHCDRVREGFPVGESLQAARVTTLTDSITPAAETHRLVHGLYRSGAPVAAPRHRDIVATATGDTGFWQWLDETLVTPGQWGALTAAFHRAGRNIRHKRSYHPATVLRPRIHRARELTTQRGHPLFGAHALVRSFEAAFEAAVNDALEAVTVSQQLLVLGDNQPGNVMSASGRPVLNDFERIASGPPALDLAALLLGLQHFDYPRTIGQEFLTGYGPDAPTLEAARPFARIRELSGTIIAMIHAGDSPEMEHEMHVRSVSISNPGEGEPWTYVGNPNAMRLAGTRTTAADPPLNRPV